MNTAGRSQTVNVLTVGQSLRDQNTLTHCLKGAAWRLLQVADLRSSLDLLRRGNIHAVISDLSLPDGAWTDLNESHDSHLYRPPIIVATDTLDAKLWAEALSRGAYDILVKPFEMEEVLYVIRNACLRGSRAAHITPVLSNCA